MAFHHTQSFQPCTIQLADPSQQHADLQPLSSEQRAKAKEVEGKGCYSPVPDVKLKRQVLKEMVQTLLQLLTCLPCGILFPGRILFSLLLGEGDCII